MSRSLTATKPLKALAFALTLGLVSTPAWSETLTVGSGDASLSVEVDAYGGFESATYDPVGAIPAAETTFESAVAIGVPAVAPGRTYLSTGSTGGLPDPGFTSTSSSMATSSFSFMGATVDLVQSLEQLFDMGSAFGAKLTQRATITNTTNEEIIFDIVRYLDGDLGFDGSISDGGGKLLSGADMILFETDAGGTGSADATFMGITAKGGVAPSTDRSEISSFSGLRSKVIAGGSLTDTVDGDGNLDGFIDLGSEYDVTLALRNVLTVLPSTSLTYTTETFWGNGVPADLPVIPPMMPDPPPNSAIPEPSSFAVFGILGLIGMGFRRDRKRA